MWLIRYAHAATFYDIKGCKTTQKRFNQSNVCEIIGVLVDEEQNSKLSLSCKVTNAIK